jgi:hypothetical protein
MAMAAYPGRRGFDVVLRDSPTLHVRPADAWR